MIKLLKRKGSGDWVATGRVNNRVRPRQVEVVRKGTTPVWIDESDWISHLSGKHQRSTTDRESTRRRAV